MGTEAQKEYAAFEEKVKRSLYLDNLSPQVTEPVIKAAFEQYGNVISTHFIPNYADCYHCKCALVELENYKEASTIIDMLRTYPFMMSGMPRPVVARAAEPGMFDKRPANPDRKIQLYWLDPKDPDFEVAQNLKNLTKKHFAERLYLLERQHVEEEKLSKKQVEALKIHHQKYDMMDSVLSDSGSKHLAREYGLNFTDDIGLTERF